MAKKKSDRQLLESITKDISSIKKRLTKIEKNTQEELEDERLILEGERQELDELQRLEKLEQEIKENTAPHPLAQITYRDVTKGIIGSFFGIVGHFAFFYGGKIASTLSTARAHGLMITSLVVLILFIYFSGFRQVRRLDSVHYIPWRVITIYLTAHIVVAVVLFIFGWIQFGMPLIDIYKNIAAVSILAVMGAATADLIGGE